MFQLCSTSPVAASTAWTKSSETKEQADHNLPYLLAVALLDGDVMPAQFTPERIIKPDVQGLLKKVSVRPNHEYTDQYPRKMPAKITIRLKDGKTIEHEVQDYPGLASHPFTWEDSVDKFDKLVAGRHRRRSPRRNQGCCAFDRNHRGQRPNEVAWPSIQAARQRRHNAASNRQENSR